jgi:hypothetical protein
MEQGRSTKRTPFSAPASPHCPTASVCSTCATAARAYASCAATSWAHSQSFATPGEALTTWAAATPRSSPGAPTPPWSFASWASSMRHDPWPRRSSNSRASGAQPVRSAQHCVRWCGRGRQPRPRAARGGGPGARRLPAKLEHAKARTELGAALRRANRRSTRASNSGRLSSSRPSAAPRLRRARRERAARDRRAPRRVALSGVDSLAPSERRVAALAAEGRPTERSPRRSSSPREQSKST